MSSMFYHLLLFSSCLSLLLEAKIVGGGEVKKSKNRRHSNKEQAKNSNKYKAHPIKHKNKRWKIRTIKDVESGEHQGLESGEDFKTGNICSSDKSGSVGFAIDTTA